MGTFGTNILPNTTGLSLGSPIQSWLINGALPLAIQQVPVDYSSIAFFQAQSSFAVFTMTLTGNVTSSTFSSNTVGLLIFQITQDVAGGRTFAWPTNFQQPDVVGSAANQVTTQVFYFDGVNAWPIGPSMLTP